MKAALDAWFDEVCKPQWTGPADAKGLYATAGIVSAKRIVFNIERDDHRLVVAADFKKNHRLDQVDPDARTYDKIEVTEIEHGS